MTDSERPPVNLRVGFVALAAFTLLGLLLEALHGFKLGFYLDVDNETRRLLWRLAHAHGALLGLVNVCYALAARAWPRLEDRLAARALLTALVLMPLGFFFGGAFAHAGDPGAAAGGDRRGGAERAADAARLPVPATLWPGDGYVRRRPGAARSRRWPARGVLAVLTRGAGP